MTLPPGIKHCPCHKFHGQHGCSPVSSDNMTRYIVVSQAVAPCGAMDYTADLRLPSNECTVTLHDSEPPIISVPTRYILHRNRALHSLYKHTW